MLVYLRDSCTCCHTEIKVWAQICYLTQSLYIDDRLVGLVVRRLPRERKIPGSNPTCDGIFSGSSHTSDLKIGTPVATLPGAWRYRVRVGTGRPGVSVLWLGEIERLICNFYLSVAARKIFWADPSLRYTSLLLGRWSNQQPTNCILTLGRPVPGLTLYHQASGSIVTGVPMYKSLVWLKGEKSPTGKVGIKPGSATLDVDAFTTRPMRQSPKSVLAHIALCLPSLLSVALRTVPDLAW